MKDIFRDVTKKIKGNFLPGIPINDDLIHPNYSGFSIANIPASICNWLGCPPPTENALHATVHETLNGGFQHVILLLVDGLSLSFFDRFYHETIELGLHQPWKQVLADGLFIPLTSVVPSTTSSALTTLWTGRYPAEHGFIGYELFLKEFGLIANMITHRVSAFINDPIDIKKAGFDPLHILPINTLGEHLKPHHVRSFAYQHQSIAVSGLSELLLKETRQISFDSTNDLWPALLHTLQNNKDQKTYSYVYWSALDTLSHHIGPNSQQLYEEWLSFASSLAVSIANIKASKLPRTLFILCADHGQIATDIQPDYDLHNHTELSSHLVMSPTGESRLPIVFIKNGHADFVRDYLSSHWQGKFSMLPSQSILDAGLLGPALPHPTTLDRIGDHVIIPEGNAYWWWMNKENQLLGRHGGLSLEEMLIPFFALPL